MNKTQTNSIGFSLSSDRVSVIILLIPALIFCTIFIFIPAFWAIVGSFYSYGMTSLNDWKWVGFDNYIGYLNYFRFYHPLDLFQLN